MSKALHKPKPNNELQLALRRRWEQKFRMVWLRNICVILYMWIYNMYMCIYKSCPCVIESYTWMVIILFHLFHQLFKIQALWNVIMYACIQKNNLEHSRIKHTYIHIYVQFMSNSHFIPWQLSSITICPFALIHNVLLQKANF